MNMRNSIFSFLVIIIGLTNCAKPIFNCGFGIDKNYVSINSEVLTLKTIGIRDTTTSLVRGTVLGKFYSNKSIAIDTVIFAAVGFINQLRKDTIGVTSDLTGNFRLIIDAGIYDIFISYTGFNTLEISNVNCKSGEIIELDVLLGQGYTFTKVSGDNRN